MCRWRPTAQLRQTILGTHSGMYVAISEHTCASLPQRTWQCRIIWMAPCDTHAMCGHPCHMHNRRNKKPNRCVCNVHNLAGKKPPEPGETSHAYAPGSAEVHLCCGESCHICKCRRLLPPVHIMMIRQESYTEKTRPRTREQSRAHLDQHGAEVAAIHIKNPACAWQSTVMLTSGCCAIAGQVIIRQQVCMAGMYSNTT